MDHIDALRDAGVGALKIEGRQRGKAYVAEVVSIMRRAVAADAAERPALLSRLRRLSEGQKTTSGAYEKRWR
ncbi:putative protease YhbU precursor [compost metagenome]